MHFLSFSWQKITRYTVNWFTVVVWFSFSLLSKITSSLHLNHLLHYCDFANFFSCFTIMISVVLLFAFGCTLWSAYFWLKDPSIRTVRVTGIFLIHCELYWQLCILLLFKWIFVLKIYNFTGNFCWIIAKSSCLFGLFTFTIIPLWFCRNT